MQTMHTRQHHHQLFGICSVSKTDKNLKYHYVNCERDNKALYALARET